MESNRGVLAAFLGTLSVILYREYKSNSASAWPIPYVPPPYKFTWAAVVFGILALVADMISTKVATVIAAGVFIGVLLPVLQNPPGAAGSSGSSGSTTPTNPFKISPKNNPNQLPNPSPNGNQNPNLNGPSSPNHLPAP